MEQDRSNPFELLKGSKGGWEPPALLFFLSCSLRNRLVLPYCELRDIISILWYVPSCCYGSCGQYERNVTTASLVPELAEQPSLPGYVRSYRRVERLLTPKRFRYMSNAIFAVGFLERAHEAIHCVSWSWKSLVPLAFIRVEDKGTSARTTGWLCTRYS